MFVLEYERKQDLVRSVISCRASSSSNCLSDADTYNKGESSNNLRMEDSPESFLLPWIPSEEIDKITAVWRDDSEDSFIDMEEGEKS